MPASRDIEHPRAFRQASVCDGEQHVVSLRQAFGDLDLHSDFIGITACALAGARGIDQFSIALVNSSRRAG